MLKVLVIQTANNLSDERTEFLINDRLSFMRFLGLRLSDRVPDAHDLAVSRKTDEGRRDQGLVRTLRCDAARRRLHRHVGPDRGSSLVAAPKQRNTKEEKDDIKAGQVPDAWKDRSAKLRQKDRDARWTVKFTKAKPQADGKMPPVDIAIPAFGYQNHISIDREHGLIGKWLPKGRPMPETTRRANNMKSKVRSRVEYVFAEQKSRMGLFIRTIGIARHDEDRHGQSRIQHKAADLPGPHRRRMNTTPEGAKGRGASQKLPPDEHNCAPKCTQRASVPTLIEASSFATAERVGRRSSKARRHSGAQLCTSEDPAWAVRRRQAGRHGCFAGFARLMIRHPNVVKRHLVDPL